MPDKESVEFLRRRRNNRLVNWLANTSTQLRNILGSEGIITIMENQYLEDDELAEITDIPASVIGIAKVLINYGKL